jgi:hypothetical protein
MSAIATNTPTNCSVEKKIRKPPRLAAPAARMMGVRRADAVRQPAPQAGRQNAHDLHE